jgi:hypothetical protein
MFDRLRRIVQGNPRKEEGEELPEIVWVNFLAQFDPVVVRFRSLWCGDAAKHNF